MNFTILSPEEEKSFTIAWIEVNTPVGNFVIQQNHAPMVLTLSAHQPITICLKSGKQEIIKSAGGILEVTRTAATLLLNE